MKTFTDADFQGYEFRCTTASGNTGFKHICEAYKDNKPVEGCSSMINWGNRTWESFQYESVLKETKSKLKDILAGIKKPEIDWNFLNTLANDGYITDYGEFEDGTPVILMDSWDQVSGVEERTYVEGKGMVKTGNFIKSVYARLIELSQKGLLKPSIQETLLNIDYVFTDEYSKCDECGTVHNLYYNDLTYAEGLLLCDKCINSPDRIEGLIEEAKNDYKKALKPTVEQGLIEDLGYRLIDCDLFSFCPDRYFSNRTTPEYIEGFINKYNGFIQIYQVEQFDCPFQIWVPKEVLDQAQKEIDFKFKGV